jgi:hypothetical protein
MIPQVRQLEGKPHLVCQTVMGVTGVWAGSNGPLFYPADELSKGAHLWDGKPVVVYHPSLSDGGRAGSPSVFDRQRVGTVFSTKMKDGKLACQTWLDPQRLATVDPALLERIKRGEIVEVSTGLFTENDPTPGTFRGSQYVGIARRHIPDHLALLSQDKGACSVAMGAGLNRNALHDPRQVLRAPQATARPLARQRVQPLLSPVMFA